jgi:hypothetical protein
MRSWDPDRMVHNQSVVSVDLKEVAHDRDDMDEGEAHRGAARDDGGVAEAERWLGQLRAAPLPCSWRSWMSTSRGREGENQAVTADGRHR